MITLSCEVVCDECKQVVASVGPSDRMASWLIHDAVEKAKAHGAYVGISNVMCACCINKQAGHKAKPTPTVWVIEDEINGKSPSGDPCHDNFEID